MADASRIHRPVHTKAATTKRSATIFRRMTTIASKPAPAPAPNPLFCEAAQNTARDFEAKGYAVHSFYCDAEQQRFGFVAEPPPGSHLRITVTVTSPAAAGARAALAS